MVKMGDLIKHCMWYSTGNRHNGYLLAKDVSEKNLSERVQITRSRKINFEEGWA